MFTQSHQARNEASCSIPLRQHSEMQLRWLSRWAGLCTAWICTEHISPFHTIVCSWQTEIMVAAKTTHLELRRWKDRNLKTKGRASREHEAPRKKKTMFKGCFSSVFGPFLLFCLRYAGWFAVFSLCTIMSIRYH